MLSAKTRGLLFKAHRWIGLTLAPLFLLIALSGAVLAFKPMLAPGGDTAAREPSRFVSVERIVSLLDGIDPLGADVTAVGIDHRQGVLNVRAHDSGVAGVYDAATGERISADVQDPESGFFAIAERLHKELFLGLGVVIEAAAYLMLTLVAVAPFIAWPRFKNSLMGWHRLAGWGLYPLLLGLPLTAVLMTLHVGMPRLPAMSEPGIEMPLGRALNLAADRGFDRPTLVRRLRGGSALVATETGTGAPLAVVTDRGVTPLDPGDNLVKSLHEGTWGGGLGGIPNLLGTTVLALLSLTGAYSWMRRQRARKKSIPARG